MSILGKNSRRTKRAAARRKKRTWAVEGLEVRRMMAADLDLANAGDTDAQTLVVSPVAVTNAGFEDIAGETPYNEFTFGPLNGWDLYDPGGITSGGDGPEYYIGTLMPREHASQPGVLQNFPGGATEGNRVAIAFNYESTGDGGEYGLSQTLTETLAADTTYTLAVDVGNIATGIAQSGQTFHLDGLPGYRIELVAGNTVVAADNNSLAGTIPEGEFGTSVISFSADAAHPEIGQPLTIRLINLNQTAGVPAGNDLEVDFDNVRLTATTIVNNDVAEGANEDEADEGGANDQEGTVNEDGQVEVDDAADNSDNANDPGSGETDSDTSSDTKDFCEAVANPDPGDGHADADVQPQPVLLVISNQDFWYQDYADTVSGLESQGLDVVVAATTTDVATPHANSGQGADGGYVIPDLALTDVEAEDYSGIVFSGGWGMASYQYGFEGTYDNAAYNGDKTTKLVVNDLINEFVEQDKHVGAVCYGVSVLAYARVDGESLLEGRTVTGWNGAAPSSDADRHGTSRRQIEGQGAVMADSGEIGDPTTSTDDVIVDGRIITGENMESALHFGELFGRSVYQAAVDAAMAELAGG